MTTDAQNETRAYRFRAHDDQIGLEFFCYAQSAAQAVDNVRAAWREAHGRDAEHVEAWREETNESGAAFCSLAEYSFYQASLARWCDDGGPCND